MQPERNVREADPADAALQRLARRSRLPVIRLRWPWLSYAALGAFYAVTCVTLWASTFPRGRLVGVAACWLVQAATTLRFWVRGTGEMELGTYPPGALRLGLIHLVSSSVAVGLTGGLASPIFPTLLMPAITSLALFGAASESRALVALTAACLVVVGVLAGSWGGTAPFSEAVFDLLAAASALATLLVVTTNVVRLQRALRDSGQELAHVREELGSQALARARRLEEVGTQVAHELKNPLSAVKALAQLGAASSSPETREAFGAIEEKVAHLQEILRDYLSFARPLEKLRPEPLTLGPLVDEALAILGAHLDRAGVRARRRGDASVTADPRRIEEALLNLVANAIEATAPGGTVEVAIAQEGKDARIVIRDTGRGMTPDVLARVGTPFFSTRDSGAGLGVVLARAAFQQHGGSLRFESAPGEGTTVTATVTCELTPGGGAEEPPRPAVVRFRWPWLSVGVAAAFHVVAIGAVWIGGLSRERVAGVAAVCVAVFLPPLWVAARGAPAITVVDHSPGPVVFARPSPIAFPMGLAHLIAAAIWAALTGGLHSPFLVLLLGPAIGSLAIFGRDVWQSRVLLALTVGGMIVVGALPRAITGSSPAGGPAAVLATAARRTPNRGGGRDHTRWRGTLRAAGQELTRAREELASQALSRARSLEQVGAKVARELERPLAAVGTLARKGSDGCADPGERKWLAVIAREVTRMQGILAEYLSFSRPLQSFRPETVELGPLVADVLGVLAGRAARAGVREESHGDASVTADPQRLKEALLNLVANAIDATPAGGQVEVDVGGEEGQARIVIRDTGRGMDPDVLQRVGTPFFTTRENGTGLGVVLARSVFHRHGGGLRYESTPGSGTTVTATLPFVVAERSAHGERAAG